MKQPQMFQFLQQAQKNQNDPQKLINDVIGKYKPEQIKAFRQYANGFGITDEQLNNFGIKVK